MPSTLAPPLALALVLSLAATAHAGETANTGALTDCLVPPCEDSIGTRCRQRAFPPTAASTPPRLSAGHVSYAPLRLADSCPASLCCLALARPLLRLRPFFFLFPTCRYFGDLVEALDEVCCREHRVTHSDVVFRVTKSDIGTVESPCVGTTGVAHYCTYSCAVAYHQFGELCGHVDIFDEFEATSSYGLSRTSFARKCTTALQHPQPDSASWQSCDLADQWHNVVSFARHCDPGVSTALTIDPSSVAALGEDFCTSDCYNGAAKACTHKQGCARK